MKKLSSFLIAAAITLCGCSAEQQVAVSDSAQTAAVDPELSFTDLGPLEKAVYEELLSNPASEEYFIEDIQTSYVSQEYLDELAANSRSNSYFGYSLDALEEAYQGNAFVFTTADTGETVVQDFEDYQDPYAGIAEDLTVGGGVIALTLTVSILTTGTYPAISVVLLSSAKGGMQLGATAFAMTGVSEWLLEGIRTGDFPKAGPKALKEAAEGFKWGAIGGSINGGAKAFKGLKQATLNGLTMNEAAAIQRESRFGLDVIRNFKSRNEYEVYKTANLKEVTVNGKKALMQTVDLELKGKDGLTNLQRMLKGNAALDSSGHAYELHHIGQRQDSPLAVLTKEQHMSHGHNCILHVCGAKSESRIDREVFGKEREEFWKSLAQALA